MSEQVLSFLESWIFSVIKAGNATIFNCKGMDLGVLPAKIAGCLIGFGRIYNQITSKCSQLIEEMPSTINRDIIQKYSSLIQKNMFTINSGKELQVIIDTETDLILNGITEIDSEFDLKPVIAAHVKNSEKLEKFKRSFLKEIIRLFTEEQLDYLLQRAFNLLFFKKN